MYVCMYVCMYVLVSVSLSLICLYHNFSIVQHHCVQPPADFGPPDSVGAPTGGRGRYPLHGDGQQWQHHRDARTYVASVDRIISQM